MLIGRFHYFFGINDFGINRMQKGMKGPAVPPRLPKIRNLKNQSQKFSVQKFSKIVYQIKSFRTSTSIAAGFSWLLFLCLTHLSIAFRAKPSLAPFRDGFRDVDALVKLEIFWSKIFHTVFSNFKLCAWESSESDSSSVKVFNLDKTSSI